MSSRPTYEELQFRIQQLEEKSTEFKQTKESLIESETKFRLLYERAPLGYQSLDENGNFIEVNKAWLNTLGYTRDEVVGKSFGKFLLPEWQDHFKENFPKFKAVGEILGVEFNLVKKDGSVIMVSFNGQIGRHPDGSFKQTHCILHDITERKISDEALQNAYKELEEKTVRIDESNIALKVLLEQREKDRSNLEENLFFNVSKLILPSLENAINLSSNVAQKAYLEIIENNLNALVSPFAPKLGLNLSKLSPAEIKIANFVKHGKSNKEIAAILNLSPTTVTTYRQRIRKKLGLTNKQINLRTILNSE